MTTEDFKKLSPHVQDEYLNSGGVITSSVAAGEKSPCLDSNQAGEEQVRSINRLEVSLPSNETRSPEPVSSLPPEVVEKIIIDENKKQYPDGFDFQHPVEMLFILDDDIREGKVKLHDWQIQFLLDFAKGGETDETPFQALVRACNGSGKDKYCIAPCVVWLCMRFRLARAVVTSSSGVQLDNQTCFYITKLCESANRKFGNIWKINYRRYVCLATESDVICFATDEAGKAEGYHPAGYGRKMGLFESESKTVPDEIYIAQNKCTGYTHRALVSTPGIQNGHFYSLCQSSPMRKNVKSLKEIKPIDYIQYHITAYECSHLSKNYVEQMKRDLPGGENGAAFLSQVMAEFGSTDEQVVLSFNQIWQCRYRNIEHNVEPFNKAGLDLSGGGAESVLLTRNGNKVVGLDAFRFQDANDTIAHLEKLFEENELIHSECKIFGDCVGMGGPILQILKKRGWPIVMFDSRAAAYQKRTYYRRGDEVWFEFAKLVVNKEIILGDDTVLMKQLATRWYKMLEAKFKLLSKEEQRSKGFLSPDRADALVYAFSDYKSTFTPAYDDKTVPVPREEVKKIQGSLTTKGWANGRKTSLNHALSSTYNLTPRNKFSLLREEIADYCRQQKQNKEQQV